ncbi:hypothetical protein Cme02nite_03520 [Catellatospora methionotrophica]|uniref:DUF4331 domain-containing protein n=1 Tax=Catellatospora methionotrophica TaxID=121620 RepID=A0A8J3L3Y8_9ACTN|nr:DUF4331 domain-containing protein [Catellatospora methionotrophica]GIG12020.1 hypothetical protein Cme02nite_03520 [Catellatospora methionotrophica]
MSSHREAPEIAKDPVVDSTDLYAFVSPDAPDKVTLIANYVPLQTPAAGPNFYEFGDDVRYEIHVDNNGDGVADVTYRFQFTTTIANRDTFLYNTGPITSLSSPNWNRRQFYTLSRVDVHGRETVLAVNLACPPGNVGPLSTPDYGRLAQSAVHELQGGRRVFAGQRAEGFYVDLGSIFDLGNLRPLQKAHALGKDVFSGPAMGVNATDRLNVHSLAIQVPLSDVRRGGAARVAPDDPRAVVGVWTTASRRQVHVYKPGSGDLRTGPWVQLSRLGNPLVNEVLIPMADKDAWNQSPPGDDKNYAHRVARPELARLLPALYPGAFPHLDTLNKSGKDRADLLAILLTGIPAGVVPGFQNSMSSLQADMLRLNTAIPPAAKPNDLGLVGGDPAGFPNGRRPKDDVVTVELRAIAGATYALIDKKYQPDKVIASVTDGLTAADVSAKYLKTFPYLGVPYDGYHNPS